MIKQLPIYIYLTVLALVSVPATASATVFHDYISGLRNSFFTADASQTEIITTAGIAFDPTSQNGGVYDRIYLANRDTNDAKQGVYSVDIVNETSSSRLFSSSINAPPDVTVDSSGNAYVLSSYAAELWKITNPSGTPTETQMLGNYDASGDDDPYILDMVPTGFGGGYTAGSDVLIFDGGFNDNDHNAVTVVDSASTVGTPVYTTIWSEAETNSIRAAANNVDGKVYISHWNLDTADLNSTTRAYVIRLDSAGNTDRIFLDIDAAAVPKLDDAITVNPIDGSLWMNIQTADTTRDVVRVDVVNAVATGGDYLAQTSVVIEDLGYNVGANSMAFSPDGELLAFGSPDGRDQLFVYNVVPEPASWMLLCFAGMTVGLLRRPMWG